MIIVKVKDGENIDRALKQLKRKFEKIGIKKELQDRKEFTAPSQKKREKKQKSLYKQRLLSKYINE